MTLEVEAGGKTETVEVGEGADGRGPRGEHRVAWASRRPACSSTDRGFVKVNLATLETTAPGVYCIGDVAGPPMLAHKGSREGVVVAELIAGQQPHPIKYDNVPSVTYCHPEVASIGLTEEQAKERKLDYQVGRFPFSANGRARSRQRDRGLREDHPGQEVRRDPRAPTSSAATPRR